MVSRLYYSAVRRSGLAALARRLRTGGIVLCYHNVVESAQRAGEPAVHLALAAFERQLRWLVRHYDVLPLAEFADRVRSGRSLRRAAALTFDDAYQGVFEHAWPALRRAGVPATVYVPTDFIPAREAFWWDHPALVERLTAERRARWLGELRGDGAAIAAAEGVTLPGAVPSSHRPADWDTIRRAAAEGLGIGLHTATHRNLTRLTDDELHAELVVSRDVLRSHTGVEPASFAYPYGLWDQRIRTRVQEAGFSSAVTLDPGFNSRHTNALALRRVNIPASISASAFEAWTAGLRPRRSGA